jgi:hypothetical protein
MDEGFDLGGGGLVKGCELGIAKIFEWRDGECLGVLDGDVGRCERVLEHKGRVLSIIINITKIRGGLDPVELILCVDLGLLIGLGHELCNGFTASRIINEVVCEDGFGGLVGGEPFAVLGDEGGGDFGVGDGVVLGVEAHPNGFINRPLGNDPVLRNRLG